MSYTEEKYSNSILKFTQNIENTLCEICDLPFSEGRHTELGKQLFKDITFANFKNEPIEYLESFNKIEEIKMDEKMKNKSYCEWSEATVPQFSDQQPLPEESNGFKGSPFSYEALDLFSKEIKQNIPENPFASPGTFMPDPNYNPLTGEYMNQSEPDQPDTKQDESTVNETNVDAPESKPEAPSGTNQQQIGEKDPIEPEKDIKKEPSQNEDSQKPTNIIQIRLLYPNRLNGKHFVLKKFKKKKPKKKSGKEIIKEHKERYKEHRINGMNDSKESKGYGYHILPNGAADIAKNQSITPETRCFYFWLLTKIDQEEGCSFRKVETLAVEFGVSTRTIDNYIKELLEFNLIERVKRFGTSAMTLITPVPFIDEVTKEKYNY